MHWRANILGGSIQRNGFLPEYPCHLCKSVLTVLINDRWISVLQCPLSFQLCLEISWGVATLN